jgi:CheY-like chemotaxis protein
MFIAFDFVPLVVSHLLYLLSCFFCKGKFSVSQRPDIIILDLNLPKKDGREVLKEIKENNNLKNIPLVVLTTSNADKDILRAYELHANAYVTKPLDFNQFIMVVESIVNFWLEIVKLPTK